MTPDEKYILLLEKVNSQLSYSWQPMNFAIMYLAALIGLGAIAATFIIYFMGRDYRKSARLVLDTEIKARDEKIRLLDSKMTDLIVRYENKLKKIEKAKSKTNDGEIEQLKTAIRDMQIEKNVIATSSGIGFSPSVSPSMSPFSNFANSTTVSRGCSYCGKTLPESNVGSCCDDCRKRHLGF